MSHTRFLRYAVLVLAFTMLVILWGAYVRASGSGNGCGRDWPTCHGSFVPAAPTGAGHSTAATLIEFTHRATSGLALLLMVGQTVWAFRLFPRRHTGRRAAGAALAFMLLDAALGAGLVLFEMVADNKSVARAGWMSAHLMVTFGMLAAQALTIFIASLGPTPVASHRDRFALRAALALMAGALLVGTSGAVAALGDTLYPSASLAEGLRQDLSPSSHVFVRLRVWHPVLAVIVGGSALILAGVIAGRARGRLRALATATAAVVLLQMAVGLVNLVLRAPIPLQMIHLLVADAVWLHLAVLAASAAHVPDQADEGHGAVAISA